MLTYGCRLGLGIFEDFNKLRPDGQAKNIAAWTPVVAEILQGFVRFDDSEVCNYHNLYAHLLDFRLVRQKKQHHFNKTLFWLHQSRTALAYQNVKWMILTLLISMLDFNIYRNHSANNLVDSNQLTKEASITTSQTTQQVQRTCNSLNARPMASVAVIPN